MNTTPGILDRPEAESLNMSQPNAAVTIPLTPEIDTAINRAIQSFAEQTVRSGVSYDFGQKNINTGGIDCSGFVVVGMTSVAKHLSEGIRTENGNLIQFDGGIALSKTLQTHSEGQIANMQRNGADVLHNPGIHQISGGMIIGMDHGRTSFDAGRARGIDHVVMTYEDQNGQVMVAESASSKGGAHITPLSEWYAKNGDKPLYATKVTDVLKLKQDDNNSENLDLSFTNQMGVGRNFKGTGPDADLFYAMMLGSISPEEMLDTLSDMSDADIKSSSIWLTYSQTTANLQSTAWRDFYPQNDTQGLSARAEEIKNDGYLGPVTLHAKNLSQDVTGYYTNNAIVTSLQSDYLDPNSLIKLDASLNRYAQLNENQDLEVVAVDGVFREADAERVASYIEDWRAENNGEVFELGNAAVKHMLRTGSTVESLAELSGMNIEAIEEKQKTYYGSEAFVSADNPELGVLLDVIARAEGTAGENGYNAAFAHGNGEHGVDFSTMTVDQVHAWQRTNGFGSSATGRYQVMADTMTDVKNGMGLSGQELFTPELQDQIGLYLLERRGLGSYLNGEIITNEMIDNMAHEWAGLSTSTGRSVYAGVGYNGVTGDNSAATRQALEALRENYQNPAPDADLIAEAGTGADGKATIQQSSAETPQAAGPAFSEAAGKLMADAIDYAEQAALVEVFDRAKTNTDPENTDQPTEAVAKADGSDATQDFDAAVSKAPEEAPKPEPAVVADAPSPPKPEQGVMA